MDLIPSGRCGLIHPCASRTGLVRVSAAGGGGVWILTMFRVEQKGNPDNFGLVVSVCMEA